MLRRGKTCWILVFVLLWGGTGCRKGNLDVIMVKLPESLKLYVRSITINKLCGIRPKITLEKMRNAVFRLRVKL